MTGSKCKLLLRETTKKTPNEAQENGQEVKSQRSVLVTANTLRDNRERQEANVSLYFKRLQQKTPKETQENG